ncbi:hypothetical protein [Rhodococcus ruber]|nr:hypothetical protein [Rhodococcus ruber]
MKPALSRREMYEPVSAHMQDMGFDRVSTRRGNTDDLFHIDGHDVVGRGTTTPTPIDEHHLRQLHETVYLKKGNAQWVHFSYGGYTRAARAFADSTGIALFEFKLGGRIAPRSETATQCYGRKPLDRWKRQIIWSSIAMAAASLVVIAVIKVPTVGWVLAVLVLVAIVGPVVRLVTRTG